MMRKVAANRPKRLTAWATIVLLILLAFASPASAFGASDLTALDLQTQDGEVNYSYDATLYNDGVDYPGVYATAIDANSNPQGADIPTIGIPSIADSTLANAPTTESPAIICGSAFPWGPYGTQEENAREFTEPSSNRVAPYSYFKYAIMEQTAADGTKAKKLSGFDGTYVIVRIDVSELFAGHDPSTSYLHVSQEKNNALLVAVGMDQIAGSAGVDGRDQWGNCSFSNLYTPDGQTTVQYQRKTASYKLSEMYDPAGSLETDKPYFDVILFSTASIVAGADAQKEGALTGDVELSFYVDETADYNTSLNYDPQNTDPNHAKECFKKFYDEEKVTEKSAISRYTVKGSDLALETMVKDSGGPQKDTGTTYWSLHKSMLHEYYDQEIDKSATDQGCGRTITLMSEVPVIDTMQLHGTDENALKKRTLDVNSFDIQIANNTSPAEGQSTSGLELLYAWIKIADFSSETGTTGAELAIGNNATMTIDKGGKLIVDRTCQLEVEWDGATVAPSAEGQEAQPADILNNGALDLKEGGELQNDGVVTIEGTEGKPYQPGSEGQGSAPESAKGHGELTIRQGATFTNNGCFMPNGALYVQGTLVNNGKFDADPISSQDPDRGWFAYHRGIQCTWKDDVTQSNIIYGGIYVGMDNSWNLVNDKAELVNNGDILLCPGELVNMATVKNMPGSHIYLCATDKAIIPIEPDPNNPAMVTREENLDEPKGSFIYNWSTIDNQGVIRPAQVTVNTNGSLGELIVPGNYDDLFYLDLIDQGEITGTGFVYKHDLSRGTVELKRRSTSYDSFVYNGAAQLFDVVVLLGDREYMSPKGFAVSFLDAKGNVIKAEDVVNVGTYQVVVKGKETFRGKVSKTFTVTPAKLTSAALSANSFTYDGKVHKPTVKNAKAGDLALKSSDYAVAYSNSNPKAAGSYKVTVTAKGNFTGKRMLSFKINPASIKNATVTGVTSKTYTGKAIKQTPTIKVGGTTLKAGTDYELSYKNNVNVGTATVTAKGKGNYTGSVSKSFKIAPVEASVTYRTNVESIGWQSWVKDGVTAGTSGKGLRLEALQVKLAKKAYGGSVQYRAHVQNKGWMAWASDGGTAGVANSGLRMEAVQIKLTGEMAKKFDVYYRLHVERTGWMGWAKNGAQAGTSGFGYRVEAMQVKIVPKGSAAPGSTANCFMKTA